MTGGDPELEGFKQGIDLVALAESYGYRVVGKRGAFVEMKHPDGEKLDIALHEQDGHPVFKSWNSGKSGSVVDLVMHREGVNLGQARKILRNWTQQPRPTASVTLAPKPHGSPFSRPALVSQWVAMPRYSGGYLESRGLNPAVIAAASKRIRIDERGNVAFRHDDLDGLTGWELKNKGFTGFARGGRKAFFALRVGIPPREALPRLIVAESALDALSFHQLDPAPALLLSFAGGLSNGQRELLSQILSRHPAAQVLTATDNDEQGEGFAALIQSYRPDAVRVHSPQGKDWNDALNPRFSP